MQGQGTSSVADETPLIETPFSGSNRLSPPQQVAQWRRPQRPFTGSGSADERSIGQTDGSTFAFNRNRLSGSYRFLTATSRLKLPR